MWLNPDDLRQWQKYNELTRASLHRWQGRLHQIAAKGLSGSDRQQDAALAAIRKIGDPDVVPALERTFAGFSEQAALVAVDAIRGIDGPVASLTLARQAVLSEWPAVRRRAASALKARRFDDFVPPLIALLASPIRSERRVTPPTMPLVSRDGNRPAWQGAFMASYVLSRETGDAIQVATIPAANNDATEPRAVGQMNAQTEELNSRIGAVLGVLSGKDPSSGPQVWWDWWHAESDTQLAAGKATVVVTENDILGPYASSQVNYNCLAAGTQVWADRGLVPIETIAVGDRVLAQDVETGELAYKPVLRTTLRPPKELCALRFNGETIVSTPGHRFWRCGSGWVKSRELESQSRLHTVTGNTPAWKAKKGETAET
ncbi:MAG TPA: polymorphic toxin-type HINT domain-containing protein [Planctomycetaceae bacterium]